MNDKITLIIIDDLNSIDLFLHKEEKGSSRIISSYSLDREYAPASSEKLVTFVINFLNEWGNDIGWQLVENTIPLVGIRDKNKGIDSIITISSDNDTPLKLISTRFYLQKKKVTPNAVKEYMKIFKTVQHLMFINFEFESIKLVHYIRVKDKALDIKQRQCEIEKPVSRSRKLFKKYDKTLSQFRLIMNSESMPLDLFRNYQKWPFPYIDSNFESVIHYLIWISTYENFHKVKKELNELKIEKGSIPVIVIGGEAFKRITKNLKVFIAINLLNSRGIIKIFIDKYNLASKLHYLDKIEDLNFLFQDLFEEWGDVVMVDNSSKTQAFDDISASIQDDNGKKKIMPLPNKIITIPIHGKGTFEIDLQNDATIYPEMTKIKITEVYNNLTIDRRDNEDRNIENNFQVKNVIEWLSGMNIIKKID